MLRFFKKKDIESCNFLSPVDGESFSISEVNDEVFSQKMMGDGLAFYFNGKQVTAPCSGELVSVFPGGHAYGIKMDNGIEVLIHIGIDTVNLKGRGFHIKVKQGNRVHSGDVLVELDRDIIDQEINYFPLMLIITETNNYEISINSFGSVEQAKTKIISWKK